MRQQAAVARFGQMALAGTDLPALMAEAVSLVAGTLRVEYAKILELLPQGDRLILRAGVGWRQGLVGQATVPADTNSQAGYTLVHRHPVIVEDLRRETRFRGPPLLLDHGVVSGMSVVILGPEDRPFGVLAAHTRRQRPFSRYDADFLQAVANVLAAAIARKRAEEALRESEERYRELFENANDIVYTHDLQGRFTSINRVAERVTGYSQQEVLSMNIAQIVAPEHLERAREMIRRKLEGSGPTTYELEIIAKDGRRIPLEVSSRLIYKDGKPVAVQGIARDVSERKRAEQTIRHLAYHDALTGLPNRALLQDRFELVLAQARRNRDRLAVMSLDLDRFKLINETLGHTVGDRLLQAVARRLAGAVREGDTIARVGGDEFVLLLSGIQGAEDAARVAEKILEVLQPPFVLEGQELHATTSIGISLYPHDGRDAETLIQNADAAMYRAKEQGRNSYQFYTPSLNARAFERLTLENSLRRAVDREEFVVHYQPQVDVLSGRIVGAEALVRWQHPERGLVPPADFIPLAEETGLIVPLGEWVLRAACSQSRAWQDAGLAPLRVAVNLSARQFRQPNLVDMIDRVLGETGLDPHWLELEITEGIAMQNADLTIAVLQDLMEMGIRISIDDFGAGYSSLSYLKNFPIYKLKIDRSFVRDLTHDRSDAAIATAIIAMAHSLNLRVNAEGVETEDQLSFLKENRCDEFQGYLFSRPIPAETLGAMLGEDNLSAGRPGMTVTP